MLPGALDSYHGRAADVLRFRMFLAAFLLALAPAHALDRPALDAALDSPCSVRALHLSVSFTPPCDGVYLSTARYRWYGEMVEWGDGTARLYAIDQSTWKGKAEAWAEREAWYQLRLVEAQKKPAVTWQGVTIGAGVGIATVLLGALSVRAVAEAPLYQ